MSKRRWRSDKAVQKEEEAKKKGNKIPKKTKKGRDAVEATYPIGYPFEELLDFIVACKDTTKLFHNSHDLNIIEYYRLRKFF